MTRTASTTHVTIESVDAIPDEAALTARFVLGGRPLDPQWQGAFGRALGARAPGSHGRWRFDGDAAIEVAHVDVDGAAVVVAAVDAARAVANAYVDDLASEGRRRRAEEATQAAALEERAAIAGALMRDTLARLGGGTADAAVTTDAGASVSGP